MRSLPSISQLFLTILVLLRCVSADNDGSGDNTCIGDGTITTANLRRALDALPGLCERGVSLPSTQGGIPGLAVAVVYDGQLQYSAGFGVKDLSTGEPVSAETVFQIASSSKPLAATTVAAIVSSGNIAWESPINRPGVTAEYPDPWISTALQITDGFCHRSSLNGVAGDDLELVGFNRTTILQRLQYTPPSGPFRIKYAYSNYGVTTAAVAAASSTGLEWADAARTYLYEPLGMDSTSSSDADFLGRANRATLHYPSSADVSNRTWIPRAHRDPEAQAPAGGVSSNVLDLSKWLLLNLAYGRKPSGEQLISESALNATFLPRIVRGTDPVTGDPGYYALGWDVDYRDGHVYHQHAGAFEQGVRSLVKMDLATGLGVVVLVNAFPTGWPEGVADTVFDIAMFGRSRQDWVARWNDIYSVFNAFYSDNPWSFPAPASDSPPLALEKYVGAYYNAYVGTARISRAADSSGSGGRKRNNGGSNGNSHSSGLVLTFDDSQRAFPLEHRGRDTFTVPGGQPSENFGAIFAISTDGTAGSVTITQFEGNGRDVLVKIPDAPADPNTVDGK